MIVYGRMRGIKMTIEQPLNSLLYWCPEVSEALRTVQALRCVSYLGAFGAHSVKPIEIMTTQEGATMQLLVRGKREANKRLGKKKITLVTTGKRKTLKRVKEGSFACRTGWSPKHWTQGKKGIQKKSQEYPK